jgi:peptide/nickel transport system substrate-binding protein
MTESQWWNDPQQLDAVYQRFLGEGLGRRAFLKYVGAIGGASALTAAVTAIGEAAPVPVAGRVAQQPRFAQDDAAPAGTLVLAQGADPETLDPHRTTTRSTWNVLGSMYETLTRVMFSAEGEFELQPGLATSWELNEGSDTEWTVTLQDGVTYHNGEAFDAEAAKFSIDRMLEGGEELIARTYVQYIESVEVVDPLTLAITTTGPYPLLPLDMSNIYMVPPQYTAETAPEEFALQPVGTGPFRFVEWVPDDHLTVEANTGYWSSGPRLQSVQFLPIPEGSTRAAGLSTGEVDVATLIAIPDVATLQNTPDVTVHTGPSQRTVFIVLSNLDDGPTSNQMVRQALNYAVNKEAIIENVMQGYATILQGQTITPQYFGFNPDLAPYPYDPDRARELLAEAGYPDGFDATLYTPRGRYVFDFETSQAVAGLLAEVGVNVTVEPLEWAVFIERLANSDLGPMTYYGWATYNDGARMVEAFSCDALYSHTCIPEFDEVYLASRATLDTAERERLIHETMQIQHDQAMAIFLFQLQNLYGTRQRVENFVLLPNESFFLQEVSVAD